MFKPCIIIPVYKHANALNEFIDELAKYAIIIVDDGNSAGDKAVLDEICGRVWATLVSLPKNSGKGAAMIAGFAKASSLGYSHALQLDADGQHALESVEQFMKAAEANPAALINGYPVYDDSAVKLRQHGRKITNFWVMLETRSHAIKDAMCGFRVYPLALVERIFSKAFFSKRMGFDIEIIVKAYWLGAAIINLPVRVTYMAGGHSNFRMLQDNLKISLLHAYLFIRSFGGYKNA